MYLGKDLKLVKFVLIKNKKMINILFIGDKLRMLLNDVENFFVEFIDKIIWYFKEIFF